MNSTMMMQQSLIGATVRTPCRLPAFKPSLRRSIVVRADPLEDLKDKTKDFVEETKKNSGLDENSLSNQAGNERSPTFGTTDLKTGAGDEVAEVFSPAGKPGGATSLVEITNGRAAMFAMLAAFGAEVATRQPVLIQIQKAPLAIAATFVTIIAASAIPVLRGANLQQNGLGPFTRDAEIINGRIGMVAFALLLAVETFKAGPGLVP